jgi:hypothetical protein
VLPGRSLETAGNRRPRRMIAARVFREQDSAYRPPGLHMRSAMTDRPEKSNSDSVETQRTESVAASKRGIIRFIFLVVIVAGSVALAYNLGIRTAATGKSGTDSQLTPAFSREPSDKLFSSSNLLKVVGQSPVDPSKVLFPSLERKLDPEGENKPKTCPPGLLTASSGEGALTTVSKTVSQPGNNTDPASAKSEDATKIETKQPPGETSSDAQAKESSEPPIQSVRQEPQQITTSPVPTTDKQAPKRQEAPPKAINKVSDQEEHKSDQFQLPGSVKVKIHNYSGVLAKWGLMVIIDDSAAMGRKNRLWTGGRIKVAQDAVAKLPESVTPGSKIALRDFQCNKADKNSKTKVAPCLSRMALDWTEGTFSGLNEKAADLSPAGTTNPCAAALYSLKKDFSNHGSLTPRVLIIADASGKCSPADVVKIGEQTAGKDRIHVDVISLGAGSKKNSGYLKLAKKTNGLFLKVQGPGELDQAMGRYAKALKTPLLEKLEIKGDKAVYNITPEEEIALAPGNYSIVLPLVAGIPQSKRTIPSVKVSSGEAVVLDVSVKKGRVSVSRSSKKSAE